MIYDKSKMVEIIIYNSNEKSMFCIIIMMCVHFLITIIFKEILLMFIPTHDISSLACNMTQSKCI